MKTARTKTKPQPQASGRALDLQAPKPAASTKPNAQLPRRPNTRWPAKAHPARFSLRVAASLAATVGVVMAVVLEFNFDSDIGLYLITAGAVVVVVGAILAQSALLYGISRFDDGRATPRKYWWAAARDGFMDAVNADMMALIVLCGAVLLGVSAWRLSLRLDTLTSVERAVGLAIINLLLGWVVLGAYTARRMALAAVVVGGITAGEATRIGWVLYLRGGGHLVLTAVKALLGRLVALAIVAAGAYGAARWLTGLSLSNQTEITVASSVIAAVAVFLIVLVLLEWETRLWLRHYRLWVTTFTPPERLRLLTGRLPAKS